jgi:hypothetical protein
MGFARSGFMLVMFHRTCRFNYRDFYLRVLSRIRVLFIFADDLPSSGICMKTGDAASDSVICKRRMKDYARISRVP